MASIKIIRAALRKRGQSVSNAESVMAQLRSIHGGGWTESNLQVLLSTGPPPFVPSLLVDAPIVAGEKPDYFENPNSTFQCNHCDRKPYQREQDCIKHIETKHAALLRDA
jgi:hypothetical protein